MNLKSTAGILLASLLTLGQAGATTLQEAVNAEHRSDKNKARDVFRKPQETLEFLGLKDDMTVVEIWPGGGWYTEILAPVLRDNGKLIAAQYDMNGPYNYQRGSLGAFFTKMAKHREVYRKVEVREFSLPYKLALADKGSADMVLTFRNVHNLVANLYCDGHCADVFFMAAYDALKQGGYLGHCRPPLG